MFKLRRGKSSDQAKESPQTKVLPIEPDVLGSLLRLDAVDRLAINLTLRDLTCKLSELPF
jgi:hypothetical protein